MSSSRNPSGGREGPDVGSRPGPGDEFCQSVARQLHDGAHQSLLLAGYLLEEDPPPVAKIFQQLDEANRQLAEVTRTLLGSPSDTRR